MPALTLLGRRSEFGGDDLQPSALLTILVRSFQMCFLLVPVLIHLFLEASKFGGWKAYIYHYTTQQLDSCDKAAYFPLFLLWYAILSTVYTVATAVLEFRLFQASSVGTPTQPRSPLVARFMEFKLVPLALANGIIFGLGILALSFSGVYYHCRNLAEQSVTFNNDRPSGDETFQWTEQYASDENIEGSSFDLPQQRYLYYLSTNANNNDDGYNLVIPYLLETKAWWAALLLLLLSQGTEALLSLYSICSLLRQPKVSSPRSLLFSSESTDFTESEQLDFNTLYQRSRHALQLQHELSQDMWDARCRKYCKCAAAFTCYLFGGREIDSGPAGDLYGDIARTLADYLEDGGVLDLVASDLVVGFMMLQRVQRQRVLEARRAVLEERCKHPTPQNDLFANAEDMCVEPSVQNSLSLAPVDEKQNIGAYSRQSTVDSGFVCGDKGDTENGNLIPMEFFGIDEEQGLEQLDSFNAVIPPDVERGSKANSLAYRNEVLPTDIVSSGEGPLLTTSCNASLGITALKLRRAQKGSTLVYVTKRRKILSRDDELDRNVIAEGAHFARHQLAIYTWMLYLYMYPGTGVWKLGCARCLSGFRKRLHKRKYSDGEEHDARNRRGSSTNLGLESSTLLRETINGDGHVIGDNFCQVHKTALLAHAGLEDSDLVYAHLKNNFHEMPYCVILDHKWKSVVVSIRGTLSLEDCVVDVLLVPDSLEELGREHGFDGEGQYCHSGVLGCAKFIYQDLRRHGILDGLLLGDDAMYSHYTLRIVGHSLGAAAGAILSFMLRSKFPHVRCLCYSPPGGFLTLKLAVECSSFVQSFVLDSDLVPRLSVDSMENLRDEVLELIGRIKVPKIDVVRSFVADGVFNNSEKNRDPDFFARKNAEMLYPKGEIPPDSEFSRQLENFKAIQRERKRQRGQIRDNKLFPPGRIVHLVKTGERKTCLHGLTKCLSCCMCIPGAEYTPIWSEHDDFNEIVVSQTMGTDHFPNRVCIEIEGVAAAFGLDTSRNSAEFYMDRTLNTRD